MFLTDSKFLWDQDKIVQTACNFPKKCYVAMHNTLDRASVGTML